MTCFGHKTSNFDQQPPKPHKITSYFYEKRKFLRKIFWSLGTNLGYPGAGSQADLDETFSKCQILVILDPNSLAILVAYRGQAKTPKTFPPWCESKVIIITRTTRPINKISCRGLCGRFPIFWSSVLSKLCL